jgi:hypothetical protein
MARDQFDMANNNLMPARFQRHISENQSSRNVIYFIRAKGTPYVKIGTATDVAARLDQLQHYSPEELELMLTIPGDRWPESLLHNTFGEDRVRGEWFKIMPTILDFMVRVQCGAK